jgi:DNA-binding GntR family transcriptional regulator
VTVEAVRLLVAEGFVEARSGFGSYVRQRPERQRLTRSWYTQRRSGSPFRADMAAADIPARGSHLPSASRCPAIAARLGAEPGDLAMRTTYTFLGDGKPVMLSVSWEPTALTTGTASRFPRKGRTPGRA